VATAVQLVVTLVGLVLALVHTRVRTLPRSAFALDAVVRTATRLWGNPYRPLREAWELIGQGGKVFETGPVRSLLQLDGTLVTRAPRAAVLDTALADTHSAAIRAWITRLLADWERLNLQLRALAGVLGAAGALAWIDLDHAVEALEKAAVVAVLSLGFRGVIAAVLRYLVFRAR
jgi:hypothetical protein